MSDGEDGHAYTLYVGTIGYCALGGGRGGRTYVNHEDEEFMLAVVVVDIEARLCRLSMSNVSV